MSKAKKTKSVPEKQGEAAQLLKESVEGLHRAHDMEMESSEEPNIHKRLKQKNESLAQQRRALNKQQRGIEIQRQAMSQQQKKQAKQGKK